jgi:hypothetical protein
MFCPKVVYNNLTATWVMWINPIMGANFGISYYAVATAKAFTGPFSIVSRNVSSLAHADVGDFNLFVDEATGKGYVIYTSHIQGSSPTHDMSIEELTPDYTASRGAARNSGFFGHSFVEAPAMFKRGEVYYAVFGQCCCYCEWGSPVYVYTAAAPLGPYTMQEGGPIDRPFGKPFSKEKQQRQESTRHEHETQNNGRLRPAASGALVSRVAAAAAAAAASSAFGSSSFSTGVATDRSGVSASGIAAQQTDITSFIGADGERHFIWIGDRWQQAPDGIKGHDPTYWGPLAFTSSGAVAAMVFEGNFTIQIRT